MDPRTLAYKPRKWTLEWPIWQELYVVME